MGHKCFISFKSTDMEYKKYIQDNLNVDMIDKSLNEPINSEDQDYIMKVIRRDYLNDSTVTICLIGSNSAENLHPFINQYYIKELQASLSNTSISTKMEFLVSFFLLCMIQYFRVNIYVPIVEKHIMQLKLMTRQS